MVTFTSLVLVTVVVSVVYFFFNNGKPRPKGTGKPLPGPRGLPILGSLFDIGLRPHIRFAEWIGKYGKIFGVKLANYNFVVISDAKIAREAYSDPALLGRPPFELFNIVSDEGKSGLTTTQGHAWMEQRRFTLRHLRDFGFGKSSLQNLVMDEVNEFVEWLQSQEGQSISLNRKFSLATVNSLWQIMTGKRFKQTDPELNKFLTALTETFSDVVLSPIALFYPKLAQAFPSLSGWGKIQKLADDYDVFTTKPVQDHLSSFNPNEQPRDFIDSYIQEIRKTTDPKSTFYKKTGERSLEIVVGDLFGAGSETTAKTLSWAILYLTKFPETLKKMQQEIDSVVGQSRAVTLDDRKSMAYAEAVILETLRKSSLVPFGLFHYAMETTTVCGYTIPKDSWIAVNQHFIHHDPEIWGDPENFRPERWLSPDGTSVVKNDNLVAFSVGKRNCIGEQIAKDSLFLFLTNIVQKFSIQFDQKLPEPSLEPGPGFILFAHHFNVIMKDRSICN